jgi:hypothetical protein
MFLIKTAMLIHFGVYRTRFHSSQHSFPPTEVSAPRMEHADGSFMDHLQCLFRNGHVEDPIKLDGSLKLPWLIGSYRHVYFLIEMG